MEVMGGQNNPEEQNNQQQRISQRTSCMFKSPLAVDTKLSFGVLSKTLPTEGNLAWEYNPLRNYRLTEGKYYFRNKLFTKQELETELGKYIDGISWNNYQQSNDLPNGIKTGEQEPQFYDAGQLVDFDTKELKFSINHPVDILPQYSYDGSVNLIINDGLNAPKLINTRFSPIGRNKYRIQDRKGNNDTNIYDMGSQFDSDTSLYKTYASIPKVEFLNVCQDGQLSVGNYHFYFKYVDADGNETDFIAESGVVSIFKGTTLKTINSGLMNENSYKSAKFIISNIDPAYQYINVYYTKSTSNIYEQAVVSAYKIEQKYSVNNALICYIQVTGAEPATEIPLSDINPFYQIVSKVQTQVECQNMLFFGNVQDRAIDYEELSDLSLRFCASPDTKTYTCVDHRYSTQNISNTYSDPKFIYNYTGYQNKEIYRFGVVYIMNDGSLSPVFNIRGQYFKESTSEYTNFKVYDDGKRAKITFNEDTGIVISEGSLSPEQNIENVFGVVKIDIGNNSEFNNIIGIKIGVDNTDNTNDLKKALKDANVKGLFFVRQKRIPLRLCQAYVTGVDREANIPLLYTEKGTEKIYVAERFLTQDRVLDHEIDRRIETIQPSSVNKYGAFCPEYDVNGPYLNGLFCGDKYIVQQASKEKPLQKDSINSRHYYADTFETPDKEYYEDTRILGVEDNVKLVAIGDKKFSSRAGEATEIKYFEYITNETKSSTASNLARGIYGPYIAFDGYSKPGTIVNIYINEYLETTPLEQFKLRYADKLPFYAISDRLIVDAITDTQTFYRGDSYICTFTHRVNRNFQDPTAPINDKIVSYNCWRDHFKIKDGQLDIEEMAKINLGDINAIQLGTWVTFNLVSSINLNIRSLDDSRPDEVSLNGHARGFYPYDSMNAGGAYKIPEALCYNKGFDKSVSERWNYEVPNVPFLKNDFSNRIMYSDISVNDSFKNGFRVFQGTNYRDYPKTYGSITKLVELNGQLICVFEHGIALLPVRERALAGQGAGGNIYINVNNVLPETLNILSDTFGSQWKDSIIQTPAGIYGVDTVARKIWKVTGNSFKVISDFAIQEFLNNNISLTERELDPIIGIRNVKTHYNKFKNDVMFTFYDNLHGFEEKVWNLCFNELLNKWITFYSWVPSYSENIYNQFFSFDRNTSKWITKLGISKSGNSFSDGVVLSNNIIGDNLKAGDLIGILDLANRTLPQGDNIQVIKSYKLVRDNFRNWKNFEIKPIIEGATLHIDKLGQYIVDTYDTDRSKIGAYEYSDGKLKGLSTPGNQLQVTGWGLYLKTDISFLKSEFYERDKNGIICKDNRGRREWLPKGDQKNSSNVVQLLNIRCNIQVLATNKIPTLAEAYNSNLSAIDAGYYESVVAVIPKYNLQYLTTDFWKHGQAGIIDVVDEIHPTYWYGKQHPFEFECVVAGDPRQHKIFNNLELSSNKTAPESFHYEITGECYDFAKDKENMYIRQEATKELYQYNGSDILFNPDYKTLKSEHRKIQLVDPVTKTVTLSSNYDKSTLLPLYYSRQDTFNDIEDYYAGKTSPSKDYSKLAGAEIVRYENLNEYRIWNHTKAVDINGPGGRMRGNMQYKEDKWDVQINPLNIVYCNEPDWASNEGTYKNVIVHCKGESNKVPIELGQSPIPSDVKTYNNIEVPIKNDRGIVTWKWEENQMKESKLKDRFVKIRVRYTGDELALVTALKTNYSISIS